MEVHTPAGKLVSRCVLLICCADLPAKAKVANSVQYNGYNGCMTCDSYGTIIGRVVHWPHDRSSKNRTHESIIACARQAVDTETPV